MIVGLGLPVKTAEVEPEEIGQAPPTILILCRFAGTIRPRPAICDRVLQLFYSFVEFVVRHFPNDVESILDADRA